MRGFFSQSGRARLGASLGLSVGISLCAGALIVGPLATPVVAAPTIGGDENGPQVQILQPAYQDVLKGKSKIIIAVKTRKFNPQFVEMFVDDKPATLTPLPIESFPSAQYDWPTQFLTDGPHKLMVRVTDTQGFRGWAEVNVFINNQKKIDTVPPSLKWQNTKSFQQLSGTASIQLDALDNFGVKWLFISLSKASEPNTKLRSWMLNRPPYTVKLDTTQMPDGLYQLQAKAYDSFEQEGEAPPLTLGIVNNAVNATTIGDMLAGLQRVAQSNQKTTAPVKTGRKFTPDVPGNSSAAQAPTKTTPRIATNPGIAKPRVIAPPRAETPKTPLSPSLPPMIVRNLPATPPTNSAGATPKTQVVQLAVPSVDGAEVAAPQLSSRNGVEATRSSIKSEIGSALSEDWRARFARADAPDAPSRAEMGQLALPLDGARAVDGAPLWSDRDALDASRRAALAPLKVEAESAMLGGRLSAPGDLLARAETDSSAPQISAPQAPAQPKISPREAIGTKIEALKVARSGKAAKPNTARVAALPRPDKGDARGAITAISVSPLQVNLSDAVPAWHVAVRSTDLRAVAARYGLPVAVVAANNGWKSNHVLAAGDRVKLPRQLKVAYRGVPVTGDAPSMLVGGVGVTAFRFMFERAGGKLVWDAKKQRVIAHKGKSEVVLSIGSNHAKVGDKDVMLELAAFLFEGRTMVPVRFFEEGLRAEVEWDPQTGRLVVAMTN